MGQFDPSADHTSEQQGRVEKKVMTATFVHGVHFFGCGLAQGSAKPTWPGSADIAVRPGDPVVARDAGLGGGVGQLDEGGT